MDSPPSSEDRERLRQLLSDSDAEETAPNGRGLDMFEPFEIQQAKSVVSLTNAYSKQAEIYMDKRVRLLIKKHKSLMHKPENASPVSHGLFPPQRDDDPPSTGLCGHRPNSVADQNIYRKRMQEDYGDLLGIIPGLPEFIADLPYDWLNDVGLHRHVDEYIMLKTASATMDLAVTDKNDGSTVVPPEALDESISAYTKLMSNFGQEAYANCMDAAMHGAPPEMVSELLQFAKDNRDDFNKSVPGIKALGKAKSRPATASVPTVINLNGDSDSDIASDNDDKPLGAKRPRPGRGDPRPESSLSAAKRYNSANGINSHIFAQGVRARAGTV